MSPTVIILIILGLIFIIASFAISVQLEKEKEDDEVVIPNELEEQKKEKIRELVDNYMNEYIDDKLVSIEAKFSEIVNEKTLALGDYAVSVNEEIEKNHNEVLFLHSMLQDKQKEILDYKTNIEGLKSEIQEFIAKSNTVSKVTLVEEEYDKELEEAMKSIDEGFLSSEIDIVNDESSSNNDIILNLHKSGLSILEIAKQLGLGVGEVKLVVDLYQGANK